MSFEKLHHDQNNHMSLSTTFPSISFEQTSAGAFLTIREQNIFIKKEPCLIQLILPAILSHL